MLTLTKCKSGAAALTQLDGHGKQTTANMCNTEQGVVFDFEDKKAQQQLERMMTPSARAAVRQVLGVMDMLRAKEGAALLQEAAKAAGRGDEDASDDEDAAEDPTTTTTTTAGIPTPPVPKERVVKRLDVTVGYMKCPTTPPDCGLLHDNMSLMWGKFKDLVMSSRLKWTRICLSSPCSRWI
jgi:prolyl-tRNA synthetase